MKKTTEQIQEWHNIRLLSIRDAYLIEGYCVANGHEGEDVTAYVDPDEENSYFDDFVQWYNEEE